MFKPPLRLSKPGFYEMEAADYHADPSLIPSLSSSIAKKLIMDTPRHAYHAHPRLNENFKSKSEKKFNLGSVVHELILGKGGGYEVLEFESYTSKAAKEARDAALAFGKVPILENQFGEALLMRDAVFDRLSEIHVCRDIFLQDADTFQNGTAEHVMIWNEPNGAICRAMIDWHGPDEHELWDIKTTGAGLSDAAIDRTIENLGYDLSAAFYVRGVNALCPHLQGRVKWRWIFVEDEEPFECRVIEPTESTLALGDRKARYANEIWTQCMLSGRWPGYPNEIYHQTMPEWAERRWLDRELKFSDDGIDPITSVVPERSLPTETVFSEHLIKWDDRL
jgi:hypothetical protein